MATGGGLSEDFSVLRPRALFSSACFNPPQTFGWVFQYARSVVT